MIPLNFLSKIVTRPHVSRTLTTSCSVLRQCGRSGDREDREDNRSACRQSCPSIKKRKPRNCDVDMETFKQGGQRDSKCKSDEELPDYCSKQMALECAQKIKELQKQWEAIAAAAPDKSKGQRKKPEACAVRAPRKEEEGGGGNVLFVVGLLAILAALGYYLYTQSQQNEEEKKEEEESKPE
ncbi:hypothetical protein J6590_007716 [Homalodisca vitripennis]|nr:hypothetical protein J6590_007716 [Homalodisca vitripennis]